MMKEMYNFDQEFDRTNTDCNKYSYFNDVVGYSDILPMAVADMDFSAGDFILDELAKRVSHGDLGYTWKKSSFWQAIRHWLLSQHDWQVKEEWLLSTPGVVPACVFAILALTQKGDGVLIQTPAYQCFADVIHRNERIVLTNPLVQDEFGQYQIDFEDLEEKIKPSKLFILCNPQNPTGRVFSRDELIKMGELCVKYGVPIVSDEIHMDFVYDPHCHLPIASLNEQIAQQTITVTAPSKTFNIAGLSTAYAVISNDELRAKYHDEIMKIHCDGVNVFGMLALKAAYSHGSEWVRQMKDYLQGNIDYTIQYLSENMPEIKAVKPQSTFLLWLDFRNLNMSQEELNLFLLEKARLGLNDGLIYGKNGQGFMRMNIGAPRATIQQALKQLHDALVALK